LRDACCVCMSRIRERDPYLFGAILCLAATWPALVGVFLGLYPLIWWSVVTAYVGISWLAPGVLAGASATRRAKARSARRPNLRGVLVGFASSLGLLVVLSSFLAAAGLGDVESDSTEVRGSPAKSDQQGRVSLVTQATLKRPRNRFGPVISVYCGKSNDSLCVVTYDAPACQLWVVENVDDVDAARPFETPSEGGFGTYDESRGEVGCHWDFDPPVPVP
jgi:hypothetical protein